MRKRERHQLIIDMINAEKICTQKGIQERLEARGVAVTQTTLSRDLRSLGLIKKHGAGKSYYVLPNEPETSDFIKRLSAYVLKVERAEFMLVIHTRLGEAGVTSNIIDAERPEQVLGTIAGADTVAVICRDTDAARQLELVLNQNQEESYV